MKQLVKGHNLFVRADADSQIGTGHVMRCIALAQACQKKGMRVVFVGRIESEKIQNRLAKEGFEFIPVTNSHPDAADLQQLLRLLGQGENRNAWTVLDGYHFSSDYQQAVHETGGKLLVIDDYAHQKAYHADLLLNQNVRASRLNYSFDPAACLLGPRYALLRQEFLSCAKTNTRNIPARARRIMVTMGGADPDNATGMVIKALHETRIMDLEVRVVVGPANPNTAYIEKELQDWGLGWELLRALDDMPSVMAWADLAVSASGSTCWELAYLGVPTMVLILSENQTGNAVGLHEYGAAVNCGWFHSLQAESLAGFLLALIEDRDIRRELSIKGRQLVDGKGAYRIAERISPTELHLRNVQPEDCELIFQWANDPAIRAASFHTATISWEEHKHWFDAQLCNEKSVFWIAVTAEGEPIGQVRFHIRKAEAEISISLGADYRGYGWGERLLLMACKEFFCQEKADRILAFVKKDNWASQRIFERAGFIRNQDVVRHGTAAISMSCMG